MNTIMVFMVMMMIFKLSRISYVKVYYVLITLHLIYLVLMQIIMSGILLATEPGISLIILTPMKILQRNLNRSKFVV